MPITRGSILSFYFKTSPRDSQLIYLFSQTSRFLKSFPYMHKITQYYLFSQTNNKQFSLNKLATKVFNIEKTNNENE